MTIESLSLLPRRATITDPRFHQELPWKFGETVCSVGGSEVVEL